MEATSDFSFQCFLFFGGGISSLWIFIWSDVFIFSWPLSLKYMSVGGMFGSRPLGRRRGERKSWCLPVALVTGITSLQMRACPPRKPGFNFPFEMKTGPCCQFRSYWSAVWQILAPWGCFFCPDYSLAFHSATPPWSDGLMWVKRMASLFTDTLPSILRRIPQAVVAA